MFLRRAAILAMLFLAIALAKKKSPDETETLALPVDPPPVAIGIASRLLFHAAPLSNKGLLSQQTRDALKAILKLNGGVRVVHVRALVAGSGDLRRVPQIVSQVFGEKHMPLPSVSVVQVGALPMEGAQVLIEAVSEGKKDVNGGGLIFGSGPSPAVATQGNVPLQLTCFVDSLRAMPGVNVVQIRRGPAGSADVCEAVTRSSDSEAPKLAFTGTQVAFGTGEKAFQRIDQELADAVPVVTHIYSPSARPAGVTRRGVVFIPVEGIASVEGSFATDAIAVAK